ncbi:hypothetical protein MN116_008364 [Schistosoma mekongi]|uniref:Uncharacterized protein n=1 Tax=Schistosoma mekongi TaxID=38744 RepID=A0AAE2D2Q9_SCHME|nr:hypothetical protein MN116_008364 [Schistosoma mekongi]
MHIRCSINRLIRIMPIQYRVILLLVLFVLLWMYILHEIKHSSMIILNNEFDPICKYKTMPIHKPFYDFQNTTIHIAMLLAGDIRNCYQAETQIKSILLNQRRWYPSSEDNCCHLKHFAQSNSNWLVSVNRVHSYTGDKHKRCYIVFHFIVDQLVHECLQESMTDWNLEGISVKFYSIENYEVGDFIHSIVINVNSTCLHIFHALIMLMMSTENDPLHTDNTHAHEYRDNDLIKDVTSFVNHPSSLLLFTLNLCSSYTNSQY